MTRLLRDVVSAGMAAAMVCAPLLPAHSIEPDAFSLVRDVSGNVAMTEKVGAVAVDEEMFAVLDRDYANLRIVDDRNQEVPYTWRWRMVSRTNTVETSRPATVIDLKQLPDNSVEIVVESKTPDQAVAAIVIATRLTNYEKQVTVWGSYTNGDWALLAEKKTIFDCTRYVDLRNNKIAIPATRNRFFKLLVSNVSEVRESAVVKIIRETRRGEEVGQTEQLITTKEDFRVDDITLLYAQKTIITSGRAAGSYVAKNFSVRNDDKTRETVVSFDTSRVPLSSIDLATGSANFVRRVALEACDGSAAGGEWRLLGGASISLVDIGDVHQTNLTVRVDPSQRFEHYRLRISNQDSPPISVTGVNLKGDVKDMLFLPERDRTYRIFYGGTGHSLPSYDVAQVIGDSTRAVGLAVGVARPNAGYVEGKHKSSRLSGKQVLIAGVVLMVCVLAWVITRAAKTVGALKNE